jgi:3',5'-cyclic AMP phosphodiesterase CpdA
LDLPSLSSYLANNSCKEVLLMLIAHISDLHIRPQGMKLYDHVDTNTLCARHIAYINNLEEKPDAVVITGDVVNCGCRKEYAMARQILGQIDYPTYIIPGNHDDNQNLLNGLGELFPYLGNDPNNICYTVEDHPVRLVFLDSSVDNKLYGTLGEEKLTWLRKTLEQESDREIVIFMHHHPLPSGCLHMDTIRCLDGEKLVLLLKDFPQVTRICCGHTHRAIFQLVDNLLIATAPSTAHQVPFHTGNPNGFYSLEPPAMLMHRYSVSTGLVTCVASLAPFDGPFRFETTMSCPDAENRER